MSEEEAPRGASRSVSSYLLDILDAISRIERYTDGVTEGQFLADLEKQDAVSRRLQVIGEAARHIPRGLRAEQPRIPWSSIVGMRNILSHAYHDEDPVLLWRTVQRRLSPLKQAAQQLLQRVDHPHDRAPDPGS